MGELLGDTAAGLSPAGDCDVPNECFDWNYSDIIQYNIGDALDNVEFMEGCRNFDFSDLSAAEKEATTAAPVIISVEQIMPPNGKGDRVDDGDKECALRDLKNIIILFIFILPLAFILTFSPFPGKANLPQSLCTHGPQIPCSNGSDEQNLRHPIYPY